MKTIKILIVEDDEASRLMMQGTLEAEGHHVTALENAEDAWEQMDSLMPDILFLDINLPGMSGLELSEKIREKPKYKDIYIVAATGKDTEKDLETILNSGANDYMAKPLTPKVLKIRTKVTWFIIQKIKEKKKAEHLLLQSEERHRMISENSRDSVLILKPDGTMSYLSPGTENLLGYNVKGLHGQKLQDYVHPEDTEMAIPKGLEDILNGTLEEVTEFRMKTFDGAHIWVEALHRAIQNPEGSHIKEWIVYIRESQSIKSTEKKMEVLEEILDSQGLEAQKILEKIAAAFNGKAILLKEEKAENSSFKILLETGPQRNNLSQALKLLWQGVKEAEKINNFGHTLTGSYILQKGLRILAPEEENKGHSKWESGLIQPIPKRENIEEEELKLVILSEDQIEERDMRPTKTILKLAASVLALKAKPEEI